MITICKEVWQDICRTLGIEQPEQGGILGGTGGRITAFYHDAGAKTSRSRYFPNTDALNGVLRDWEKQSIAFCGIIHSHQNADLRISGTDLAFARRILEVNAMESILFPIVSSSADSAQCWMTIYEITKEAMETKPYTIF